MKGKKKLSIAIMLALMLLIACCITAAADGDDGYSFVDFGENADESNNGGLIAEIQKNIDIPFWHYSGGYWTTPSIPRRMYDNEPQIWKQNDLLELSLRADIDIPLPQEVINYIAEGGKVGVDIIADSNQYRINTSNAEDPINPQWKIEGNYLKFRAAPTFTFAKKDEKTLWELKDYVPINNYVPLICEGYGHNVFSMFTNSGAHIYGWGISSWKPDSTRIEFTDIIDTQGHLKSGKKLVFPKEDERGNLLNNGETITADSGGVKIGNGTFSNAGACGLLFQYPIQVKFYMEREYDFEVVDIQTPDNLSGGSPVTSTVRVRNNLDKDFNDENRKIELNFWNGRQTITQWINIGAWETKEIPIDWVLPYFDEQVTVSAHINPSHYIREFNYDNNKKDAVVNVKKRNAELETITITPDTAYENTEITSYVTVKNNNDMVFKDDQLIELTFWNGVDVQTKWISLGANEQAVFEFTWTTPSIVEKKKNITVAANVNPSCYIPESDYSNNRKEINMTILKNVSSELPSDGSVDLVVTQISPKSYVAGKSVITLVKIENYGNQDFTSGYPAQLKLQIGNFYSKTEDVTIGASDTAIVPFAWIAPGTPQNVNITAVVDPNDTVYETNENNNTKTVTAQINTNTTPPYGCNVYRREWTEKRITGYSKNKKPIYKKFSFYSEVSISAKLIPIIGTAEKMKSGYAFECEVTTDVKTNYDKSGYVTGLEDVYAYINTDNFSTAIPLIKKNSNTWVFPVNPQTTPSAKKKNVQYVPVDWADDTYFTVKFTGRNGMSPGGAMCASTSASIYIKGNMYEDDWTSSR